MSNRKIKISLFVIPNGSFINDVTAIGEGVNDFVTAVFNPFYKNAWQWVQNLTKIILFMDDPPSVLFNRVFFISNFNVFGCTRRVKENIWKCTNWLIINILLWSSSRWKRSRIETSGWTSLISVLLGNGPCDPGSILRGRGKVMQNQNFSTFSSSNFSSKFIAIQ